MNFVNSFKVFTLFLIIRNCDSQGVFNPRVDDSFLRRQLPEDARMDFKQLSKKYGQTVEEHKVVTEDKYVLTLFHFAGNENGVPTLLMHGLADTCDSFILRGNKSMAVILQEVGYDVWLGNARGNKYSRNHLRLNPDKDTKFWNYSFNEIGYYDYPAFVDYIIRRTKRNKINVIGHSQGNTAFYVMAATRPEYNDKINILISLAPIAYLSHVKRPVNYVVDLADMLNSFLLNSGQEEITGEGSVLKTLLTMLCMQQRIKYPICVKGLLMAFAGHDYKQFEPEFLDVVLGHYPSATSRKTLNHFAQVSKSGRFAKYDYGRSSNIKIYASALPPLYDLSKVTMNVALFCGKNDPLAAEADVARLRKELPNVVFHHELEFDTYNHLDFIWGRYLHKILIPKVLSVLEKFS